MASERDEALSAVVAVSTNADDHYRTAIADAENRRIELANAHAVAMRQAELGWFGKLFGNESQAAMVIAFAAVLCGFLTAALLWTAGYLSGKAEPWSGEAHFALGAATSALGFVFGRGSKDSPK